MPRGGKRPGAGRKKGSKSVAAKRREEAMRMAKAMGMTPLEMMLHAMHEAYAKNGAAAAHAYAKDAAPFVHPRLAAIMSKVTDKNNPWVEILALVNEEELGLPEKPVLKLVDGTGTGRRGKAAA